MEDHRWLMKLYFVHNCILIVGKPVAELNRAVHCTKQLAEFVLGLRTCFSHPSSLCFVDYYRKALQRWFVMCSMYSSGQNQESVYRTLYLIPSCVPGQLVVNNIRSLYYTAICGEII